MAIQKHENEESPKQVPATDQTYPSNPDGHPTMSAVILTLAEPLLKKYGTNADRAKTIIALAVSAWNKAMLPAEANQEYVKGIIDVFVPPDEDAETVWSVIEFMEIIEDRRRKLFPNLRVVIADYDVKISEGKLTLNIGSGVIRTGS